LNEYHPSPHVPNLGKSFSEFGNSQVTPIDSCG
jgi:hypothetical protein